MKNLKQNKMWIVALVSMLLLSGFMATEIKKEEKRYSKLESSHMLLQEKYHKISQEYKKIKEDKDVHIVEIVNADGSKRKEKRILTRKDSEIEQFSTENSEKSKNVSYSKQEEGYIKTETIKNPKKLTLGIGINQNLTKYGIINYQFLGPLGVGGYMDQNQKLGIHITFSF